MFRAIGFVIILYAITQVFSAAIQAFENAAVATFDTIEAAAVVSRSQIESNY